MADDYELIKAEAMAADATRKQKLLDATKRYRAKFTDEERAVLTRRAIRLAKDAKLKNKLEAIELLGGKCSKCGNTYPSCVYDFHHPNGNDKKYSPSNYFGYSRERWEPVVRACVLLCANCHRIEHHGDDNV